MTRALDDQRAAHNMKRRSWTTRPEDDFLIAAIHQLFIRVEAAKDKGTPITPEGTTFLADLSGSVLKYLGPSHPDKRSRINYTAFESTESLPLFHDKPKPDVFYPEGGVRAWLVVLGSWCGLFCSIGMTNIMGCFQTYISQNQLRDYDDGTIGWIFSVYAFLAFFCGVFVGPLFDKYGPRWLLLVGSICVVSDMMLLGLCTDYWHFLLVFSLLGGLGTALIFTPCIAAIGHYFSHRRGLATGIAVSSGALGGIFLPLLLEHLIPAIGFAWSTRALACLYLLLSTTAILLVRSRLPPLAGASALPDFRIFRDAGFALTVSGVFLLEWALFVPLAYISSYAAAREYGVALSYDVLVYLNAGSVLGRLVPGYIADRIGRYNTNILVIGLAILSIFTLWLPTSTSAVSAQPALLILFCLVFGFASGSNISLAPVCLGALCRTEEYGRYYATCFSVVSLGCLTGIPIAGRLVRDAGGGYTYLIIFTGVCYVGGLLAFAAARVRAKGWKVAVIY